MDWNQEKIYEKVKTSVERFGCSNQQQLKQFSFWLAKCDPLEVFEGLIKFFHFEEGYWDRQQMAGDLLYSVLPKPTIDLAAKLKPCLKNYNLSVQELPWYLEGAYGKENILNILEQLKNESLTEREEKSVEIMIRWIKG